ncbi:hypothetical protein COO60DRAFT_1575115 [Scenedesmus sp. NREL 46B-D3]|nr:hypothetical protein COO60DRAFT_1575115 [Scenedesmus sp. NREL 46B-D3]
MLLSPKLGLTTKLRCDISGNRSLLRAWPPPAAAKAPGSTSFDGGCVQYFDVVEYATTQQAQGMPTRLGVVQEVTGGSLLVVPLVEEVANPGIWVTDDAAEEQEVPASNVLQLVEHVYSQMQDTEHNPHGEHAHDVWQVIGTLPATVFRGEACS